MNQWCRHGTILVSQEVYVVHRLISFTLQDGVSPLHAAIREGYAVIVSSLLKSGADPNAATKVGK